MTRGFRWRRVGSGGLAFTSQSRAEDRSQVTVYRLIRERDDPNLMSEMIEELRSSVNRQQQVGIITMNDSISG
jgi:hypothetical protein